MITLVFTTSRSWSWLSKLIKWFTKSRVSHVAIGTHLHGVPVLLHSTGGGVQVTLRDRWEKDNVTVSEYAFKKPPSSAALRNATIRLGDEYDYIGIIGYAILIMAWRWFKKKIRNPLASRSAVVCSEFVLYLNIFDKYPEWFGMDPERTHAQDLLEACQKGKSFEEV